MVSTDKTTDKTKKNSSKETSSAAESEVLNEKKISGNRYIEAVGRRKTSTARVRLFTQGKKSVIVNDKDYKKYFPVLELQQKVISPLKKLNIEDKFHVSVKVKGGGISAQAEAIRHGIARALVALNPYFRKKLKKARYLTRDPRMKERKKFGLKRARRAPQWSKR